MAIIQPKHLTPIVYGGVDLGQGAFGVGSGTYVVSPLVDRSVASSFADIVTLHGIPASAPTSGSLGIYVLPVSGLTHSVVNNTVSGVVTGVGFSAFGGLVELFTIDFSVLNISNTAQRLYRRVNIAEKFGGAVPDKYRIVWNNGLNQNFKASNFENSAQILLDIRGMSAESV